MSGFHVPYSVVRLSSGRPPMPIVDRALVQPRAPVVLDKKPSAALLAKAMSGPTDPIDLMAFPFRRILLICAQETGVSIPELTGPSRRSMTIKARHILCWMLSTYTSMSYSEIGKRVGGRDHTTATHAVGRVSDALERICAKRAWARPQSPPQSVVLYERLTARFLWKKDWQENKRVYSAGTSPERHRQVLDGYAAAFHGSDDARYQAAVALGFADWDGLRRAAGKARACGLPNAGKALTRRIDRAKLQALIAEYEAARACGHAALDNAAVRWGYYSRHGLARAYRQAVRNLAEAGGAA